jgi:hypothetical protein
MPFRHPDRSHDLITRIEFEVRERLEEAVDYVCLEALVRERRAKGLAPPAADSSDDRRDYTAKALDLLRRLQRELTDAPSPEARRQARVSAAGPGDEQARLLAVQVVMARTLPDYWQRFEAISAAYLSGQDLATGAAPADASRREGRGLLARLFGRD